VSVGVGEWESRGPEKRTEMVASLGTSVEPLTGVSDTTRSGPLAPPRGLDVGEATARLAGSWTMKAAAAMARTARAATEIVMVHPVGRLGRRLGSGDLECACPAGIFLPRWQQFYQSRR
jgi:hypothetical protein